MENRAFTPMRAASFLFVKLREHNLGLTYDPVGGLVQIPRIERNAMAAGNAARIAMRVEGKGIVSLDQVIRTMRQSGFDMQSKYNETSKGGLAINITEC